MTKVDIISGFRRKDHFIKTSGDGCISGGKDRTDRK